MTNRTTPVLVLSTAALCLGAAFLFAQPPAQTPRRTEALTLTIGPSTGQRAALEIAEAERAFAKLGKEKGIKESFVTWLGPEGMTFEPAPTKVAEEYPKRPDPPLLLLWGPDEVGASADGSMGFSSGPYLTYKKEGGPTSEPVGNGRFLSVWRKQADGQWRVALDFGGRGGVKAEIPSSTSEVAVRFTGFATPRPAESRKEAGIAQAAFFRALEAGEAGAVRGQLHDQFKAAWSAKDGFIHGVRITDATWPEIAPKGSKFEVTSEVTSEAGDFAYAHGKIVLAGKTDGYWMAVWLREAGTDKWQIVRLVRNKA